MWIVMYKEAYVYVTVVQVIFVINDQCKENQYTSGCWFTPLE